jgi:predicted phage-related endonuclease
MATKALLKNDGTPIDADEDREVWLSLRESSIGASDAMKLIKLNGAKRSGFFDMLQQKRSGAPDVEFWAFAHGVQREPLIARWVQQNFTNLELVHNRFVFAGEDLRHLATPDMVGPGCLAEIKTSTKSLAQVRTRYFDQLQWQMHVTGYDQVLFVVENRFSFATEFEFIPRDQRRINLLVSAANELLDRL